VSHLHDFDLHAAMPVLAGESFSVVSEIGEPIIGQMAPGQPMRHFIAIGVRGAQACRMAAADLHYELRRAERRA
jgi:hypothetical protein